MSQYVELRQGDIRRHLYGVVPAVPGVPHVRHGVAEALNLHGAHLDVEGEVCQVHGTGGLDGESHAPEDLSRVHDPQELVLCGGGVEQRDLLVDKEGVRNPDQFDVLRTNHCHCLFYITVRKFKEKMNQNYLRYYLG